MSILLASLELEPNKYTQLRIFLNGDALLVLEGEEGPDGPTVTVPLEIPSSANTGIKLNRSFEIVEGMITKLTIDFDAEKSVVKTGNGKYKMKPVIHVTSTTFSTGEVPGGVGSVSGSVVDSVTKSAIGGATVTVTLSGGSTYSFDSFTETDTEGSFSIEQLPVGFYILRFQQMVIMSTTMLLRVELQ